ncbi:hypothetical protein EBZ02_03505, partial [bacterium]|nr:hypothetical protein [bacterium]
MRARYQEKSSATPSGRPSIPAPSPPDPGASPGTAAERRDLMSAALGPGGALEVGLDSPEAAVTFFFTALTFTSCLAGGVGLGLASGAGSGLGA